MESATFRKWLAKGGCRFDPHEHQDRGAGHGFAMVHREERMAKLPLLGSRHSLDLRAVRKICEELELNLSELPGPKGRV